MVKRELYPFYSVIIAVLLFFPALGSRDFWAPVEPRYAEIARVMFADGEWIVPKVNGDLYTDKPILYFWLVLLASSLAGTVNEWTVRIPAALGGLGFVLTTYFLGRDFFNAKIGLAAALVLATSVRVVWEARWAHVDLVFVCFLTAGLYFAARTLLLTGKAYEILLSYACFALATLTKGLIGVVLPGLIAVLFLIVRRDWRLITRFRLLPGIVIFLLIAGPWFWAVNAATDGRWLWEFIYVHHIHRYTAGSGHRQPIYYYLTTLPADLQPWTVFAACALWSYRRYRGLSHEPTRLFLVVWFLAVFVFFTGSDTKRDLYLLPLFPPTALLVASYFDGLGDGRLSQDRIYTTVSGLFFYALSMSALAAPVAAWFWLREAFWISLPTAFIIAGGGLAGVCFVRRRQPWNVFAVLVLLMTGVVLWASFVIFPFIEPFKSRRPFSQEIRERIGPADRLYIFADTMHDFNYYLGREVIPVIRSAGELDALTNGGRAYVLIKQRDLRRLKGISNYRVVASRAVGGTSWNLITVGSVKEPR